MPSPGLKSHPDDGPSHNARGLLVIGPQCVTFSDILVRAAEQAKLSVTIHASHFKPDLAEEFRARRMQKGKAAQRRLYSAKEAERQRREAAA